MIILLPAAGSSPHFSSDEYAYPRPLIDVAGKPMIQWAIENLRSVDPKSEFVFVADEMDAVRYSYAQILSLSTEGRSKIVATKGPTSGALCTCLLAIDEIDHEQPLVVANSDQIIDLHLGTIIDKMNTMSADAGVITFESVHPRWSYVTTGADGLVQQTSEKEVISNRAIAGFYYYRRAGDFFAAAASVLRQGVTVEGRYFISSSLNEVILSGGRVVDVQVSADKYHSFYNPKMIENFEVNGLTALSTIRPHRAVNLLIPAAGRGSRFAEAGFEKPKPFIDVLGRPMLSHVLDNALPTGGRATVLLLREHVDTNADSVAHFRNSGVGIIPIERVTEGTACTVLLARASFDNDSPLLIANSDQLIDLQIDDFVDDCLNRGLDGSIMVFRDAERNPKWSFAELDANGLVRRVAEKVPISDYATVGIYFFRCGKDFVRAALDMIVNNERVNGEFYTCPVYNYAIRNGARIGVFEIAPSAMHGLGTPTDLAAYLERVQTTH